MLTIVLVTVAVCLATALLGVLALHLVRMRSLTWSIVVAALIPLVAVTASVVLNVQLMFISAHDSTAVSVALGCATVIGVLVSFVLGRRVALGSRRLTTALRDLGTVPRHGEAQGPASEMSTSGQPGEIVALAEELAATRERLANAQQRARALEDSRRELVAFLSHDLRTPLAGLRALAEGLEDGVLEDRPAALRQMRQTVDRMTGLVGDLFELSRLHTPSASAVHPRSMVSLVELAHDVTGELAAHAARRDVQLRLDVPAGDDRLAVRGNADELARAVTNLVGNAIRHTPRGGTVVVTTRRAADGRIEVAVTDGCGGIPAPDLARVFDVGWRATPERGTPDDAGAGLGLAIAKGVIEAHAGSIAVENVAGGCRFG
ncbi:MAG TPA: HAMP domain-containing sensor histidine kinase, partial [Lapillicoccus sp.]